MRKVIGAIIIIVAIVIILYIGGWFFFVRPIIDTIEAIKAGWVVKDIAISVGKIFIGFPVIDIIAFMIAAFGLEMFNS